MGRRHFESYAQLEKAVPELVEAPLSERMLPVWKDRQRRL